MSDPRLIRLGLAMTLGMVIVSMTAGADPPTALDLGAAITAARRNSPLLSAARLRIDEARGDVTSASILLIDNPEVIASAGPRFPPMPGADATTDIEVGLEQRFEIGGQRGHRIDRARAQVRSREAQAEDVQRVVALAVATTFYDAVAAEQRVRLVEEEERLAHALFETARLRLDRGEGTPLELNAARIRRAEVRRRLSAAQATQRTAVIRLATLLGVSPGTPLELLGDLPLAPLEQAEDALVRRALELRSDLLALGYEAEAARAAAKLADAEAWPDIALGVSYGREESNDIVLGGIRVPIPLFDRNQGNRARARATVLRVETDRQAQRLSVESEVRRAYAEYTNALEALRLYDNEVLRAQEESLSLLQRAFEAGEIGYADLIVVQREVLEGRRGYLVIQLDYARARARLLASASLPQSAGAEGSES